MNNLSMFKRLSDTKGDFLVHSTKASTEVLNFNQSKGKSQVNKPSVFKRMFFSNGDSYIRPPKASSSGTKILPKPVLPCSSPIFLNQMPFSMPAITLVHHSGSLSNSGLNSALSGGFNCSRCLGAGHRYADCPNSVRCRACFNYGHLARSCLAHSKKKVWKLRSIPKSAEKSLVRFPSSVALSSPLSQVSSPAKQCSLPETRKNPLSAPLASPMANLPDAEFQPELFLPLGTNIKVPWEARTPRADFTFQGTIHKTHENFVAAVVEPQPPAHLLGQLIQEVANIITDQHQMQVVRIQRYPLALCIVELASTLVRDVLVNSEPVLLGNWFHANFVKHDQLANWRNSPFTREGWLIILGIALHLKTRAIIEQATNLCGEFIDWHYRDKVLGRVLVKARYKSVNDIPAKLVLGDTTAFGGLGQSWTFHVFVLNGMPTYILPGDEDLLPIWQMLSAPQDNNAEQQKQHLGKF